MANKLRLGCIGTGNICRNAHIRQHVLVPEYDLTAVFDLNMAAARLAKEVYIEECKGAGRDIEPEAIKVCSTAEELLQHVDLVDICTSLRYHAYYAALALSHGVSAMSEKPMARTWLEADRVAQEAGRSPGFYQLNDDNLFIPRFLTAKALIDGGWIGDIQGLRIARGTPSSQRAQWFYDIVEGGGGAIMDYGSHAVSNAWSLIGFDKVPVEVRSMEITTREKTRLIEGRMQNINIDDDAHFKVLFRDPKNKDWIDVSIEATWTWQHYGTRSSDIDGYFEVEGTLGRLSTVLDEGGGCFIRIDSRTMGQRLIPVQTVDSEEYSFFSEFQNFARSILNRQQPFLNAQNGAATIAVLNAAQLSEREGRRTVTLDEMRQFSRDALKREPDVWKAADKLAMEFNRKFVK